jgi:stage V sporulation protein K
MTDNIKPTRYFALPVAPPIHSLQDLIRISETFSFYSQLDMITLWKLNPIMKKLDALVGMTSLKDTIFNQILYYIQGMHLRNKEGEFLHTILSGAPGTGKTTVAKIIGDLYVALGVLSPNGTFKIAKRDDFIAGYLGQTAIKTKALLESCKGGVLFVDEIYSMGPGDKDKDSFSKEAVDTLCSFLSEHPHEFCCIVAGYEQEIRDRFLSLNPGLESRFQWYHSIEAYTVDELIEIFFDKIKEIKWETIITKSDAKTVITTTDLFKNAGRDMTNLLSKCKMCHSRRVFRMGAEHKFVLTIADLQEGYELLKKQVMATPVSNSEEIFSHMYM